MWDTYPSVSRAISVGTLASPAGEGIFVGIHAVRIVWLSDRARLSGIVSATSLASLVWLVHGELQDVKCLSTTMKQERQAKETQKEGKKIEEAGNLKLTLRLLRAPPYRTVRLITMPQDEMR